MKQNINKIMLLLFSLITIFDILAINNIIVQIFLGLIISFVAFYLGVSNFRLNKQKFLVLLIINLFIILLTFRYRYLLFNIFILSFLLWTLVTPKIIKYKNIIHITILTAFITVYLFSLIGAPFPLFPIVLYPIYVFGCRIKYIKLESSKTALFVILINIFLSLGVFFTILHYTNGIPIFENLFFLKASASNSMIAMYAPFITIFSTLIFLSLNSFMYIFTNLHKSCPNNTEEPIFDINNIIKTLYYFVFFFVIIGIIIFIGKFVLFGTVRLALTNFFVPQAMFNILFLAAIYLFLIALMGRGLSTLIFSTFCLLLLFANYVKIKYFDEPFYPWDLYLIKNAIMISRDYITRNTIVIITISILTLFIIIYKFRKSFKRELKIKPILVLLPFAISLVLINLLILNIPKYLTKMDMGKSWYIGKEELLKNGLFVQNYFYIADLDRYMFTKPENYSDKEMSSINDQLNGDNVVQVSTTVKTETNNVRKPNIIVIMSESFWDLTKFKDVTFSEDITKNLKKYKRGEIFSPVFGGETANPEFEALTGLSSYFMGPGVIPYNVYLRKETPSIVSVLKNNGYKTIAIHPNSGSFYNRTVVYKNFGFDKFIDIKSFDRKTDFKGRHVSDDKLVDKIVSNMDKDDIPKFIFAVSIQNHDPYYNLYKTTEVKATSKKLDSIETSILSNYAQNIYDADRALGKLIDKLSQSKTPTILYFFGDHMPRLGAPKGVFDIYNKLDYFKHTENDDILQEIEAFKTPYIKWSNYKEMEPIATAFSPAQIAYDILKDSNVNFPSYFNILKELRAPYPVLNNRINEKVDMKNETIKNYKLIEYDILFGNQYLKALN